MTKSPVVKPLTDTPAKAENVTTFYAEGKLKIDNQPVRVSAKTGDVVLVELSKRAQLGNSLDIGTWLYKTWDTRAEPLLVKTAPKPGTAEEKAAYTQKGVTREELKAHLEAQGMPTQVIDSLSTLLLTKIWIEDLYILKDTREGKEMTALKFGVSFDFTAGDANSGLTLFGDIQLEEVSLMITSAPKDYAFPTKSQIPVKITEQPGDEDKDVPAT